MTQVAAVDSEADYLGEIEWKPGSRQKAGRLRGLHEQARRDLQGPTPEAECAEAPATPCVRKRAAQLGPS